MRLPDPMLSRPGNLPLGSRYAYEVKWDGLRAIVSTVAGLQVRSRRGWTTTDRVGELAELPNGLVLDGELVALGEDGLPSFPRLSERVLHGRDGIAITFVIFDVLAYAAGGRRCTCPMRSAGASSSHLICTACLVYGRGVLAGSLPLSA